MLSFLNTYDLTDKVLFKMYLLSLLGDSALLSLYKVRAIKEENLLYNKSSCAPFILYTMRGGWTYCLCFKKEASFSYLFLKWLETKHLPYKVLKRSTISFSCFNTQVTRYFSMKRL